MKYSVSEYFNFFFQLATTINNMLIENTIGWHYVSFLNVFAVANELPHMVLHLNPPAGFFLWGIYLFSLRLGWFPEQENPFYKWMDYNFIMSLWFLKKNFLDKGSFNIKSFM